MNKLSLTILQSEGLAIGIVLGMKARILQEWGIIMKSDNTFLLMSEEKNCDSADRVP